MRRSLLVPVLLLASACAPSDSGPRQNEILWDTWGIPHVYGTSEEAVFRGMGWAQMESHGDLILRLVGEARGRAAEYWGDSVIDPSGVSTSDMDRFFRTVGVPARGAEWFASESPEMQANIRAFVDGLNAYAEANPQALAEDMEVVLPVTPQDIMAHAHRLMHFVFVTNPSVAFMARRSVGQRTVALSEDPEASAVAVPGSNAWAIGPSRSASGNAMLVANPHLPWSHLFTWYEQHLVGPDFDLYGATLVGLPGIAIGFNDRLGWSHTVNTYDGFDLFVLELEGDGYRFGDDVLTFEDRPDTVRVREDDGSVREEVFTVRASVHGPVLAAEGDRAVALRVAGVDRGGAVSQWWSMARAGSLEEFEAALRRLQIPMFNVVYADADGQIFYLFNGLVPNPESPLPASPMQPVDGSDPATLWTEYLPYEGLPRLVDPESGWIQNANDPPWTATIPTVLDPADFAPNLAPVMMGFRPQRSANILRSDESVTFEELVAYKHDTRVEMAGRVLDELVPLAGASEDPDVQEAGRVLGDWDRTVDAGSRGGVLFERWLAYWTRDPSNWAVPWSFEAPISTPSGIGNDQEAIASLARAAVEVRSEFGAMDVAWGDIHRARRNGRDVPVSGGPGWQGIFRVAQFGPGANGTREVVAGDSYYAVMEFGPDGVRARALLAYGNSTQPGSPHVGDQLELFARQEMRPVWRSRAEVEANLAAMTVMKPDP